ncbi:MAG TPA: proton-conducting transporter membrane subunit, partial [Anaerolineales bacterium]|nr:proton-conducting transporter membrane subunit [Anaerolineales bacterium]
MPLALSVVLWLNFQPDVAGYQFREDFLWFPLVGSEYRLGVDGVSLPMVLLTALLAPLGVLFSFGVQDKVKAYMILFLLLETGSFGVFMALDLLLFFLFYEIGLIPMYFLINIWGSANKQYASFKFMLYTMAGSLGLLLATQVIGLTLGSFSIENA